jgi:hypothetical protein
LEDFRCNGLLLCQPSSLPLTAQDTPPAFRERGHVRFVPKADILRRSEEPITSSAIAIPPVNSAAV